MRSELLACDTANGSLLAGERSENMDYYQGRPFGNEVVGRSSVISTDVRDAIEWIKPTLMRIFASGENVCEFEPETPKDEAVAKQATEYVNYIWNRDNKGFQNFYYWFTDALMQKVGIVKIWWDGTPTTKRERYYGLDDQTFATLVNQDDIEVSEHTEREEEIQVPGLDEKTGQPTMKEAKITVHDVVVTREVDQGRVCVDCVAPEEFMISRAARDIETARCVAHKRLRFTNDLIEEGYDPEVIRRLPGDELTVTTNTEEVARNTVEQIGVGQDTPPTSENREVWVYEAYLKIDVDGDGIAEMRQITCAGSGFELLKNEPWDLPRPFATLTPTPMPHRFWGISVADMLKDIQLIKSTLLRLYLDNKYLQVNQREEVLESAIVDPAEVLSPVPGGKIRVKSMGSIMPIPSPDVGESLLSSLEYMDQITEDRVGVSNKTQGLGADALHDTASGERMLMNAAMGKIELIARVFAETGVTEAFRLILKLICTYQDKARTIKLTGGWVPMDPTGWNEDMKMSVSVGMGTGDRDMKMANAQMIMGMQKEAFPLGVVTPQNMMKAADLAFQAMGMKSAEGYFTPPPSGAKPPRPPDPAMIKAQADIQLQTAKQQGDMALQQQKMALDVQEKQKEREAQAAVDQHANLVEMQRHQMEMQMEAKLQQQQMLMDSKLKQMELEQNARLEIILANIRANAQIESTTITAKASADVAAQAEARTDVPA